MGEEGDDYISMAVSILLQYSNANAGPAKQSTFSQWNYSNWTKSSRHVDWDTYAGYLTFNHILYSNSPHYVLKPNSKAWCCREPYTPGEPEPEVREEAFPE